MQSLLLRQLASARATTSSNDAQNARSSSRLGAVHNGTLASASSARIPARLPSLARKPRDLQCRASEEGGGEGASAAMMTTEEAYKLLGVEAGATFDDIMNAKNQALGRAGGDMEQQVQVDAAYDLLLMERMKKRLSGDVDSSIRFADVQQRRAAPRKQQKPLLQNLPGGVKVSVPSTSSKEVQVQAAVFGALAVATLAQGVLAAPGGTDDVPGFQLALGTAAAVYFFREKKINLAPSLGYTVAALTLGAVLGGALQNWLRVDIVPIGGLGSPAALVSEFAILALWAAATLIA